MKTKVLLATGIMLAVTGGWAVSTAIPNMTRPYEVQTGEIRPHCPELVRADREGIAAFKVDGPGTLTLTDEYTCFGELAYKFTFTQAGRTALRFAKPIKLEKRGDGIEFWLIGALNTKVQKSAFPDAVFPDQCVACTDADGKAFVLHPSNACYWANTCWWANTVAFFPWNTKFPVTINAITFNIPEKGVGFDLFFDSFGVFTRGPVDLPDTTHYEAFPADPAGIRPRPTDPAAKSTLNVEKSGECYTFSYDGNDGKLLYTYTPKSGTLSDLTLSVDGKTAFYPAKSAGFRARVQGVSFAPDDPAVKATLRAVKEHKDWLRTFWRWEKDGKKLDFEVNFRLEGRTLTAEYSSESLSVRSLDAGYADGVTNPRLYSLAGLGCERDAVQFLATEDFLLSVTCDWYYSRATALMDTHPYKLESQGTPECEDAPELAHVINDHAARLTGGAVYLPKTDGVRNAPREKLRITAAPTLEGVMPRLPNPRSPFYKETSQLIYQTRTYNLGTPESLKSNLEWYHLLHDYGARDMFVRFHTELCHIPASNFHRLSRTFDVWPDFGGNDKFRDFVQEMRTVVKRVGPYENHMSLTGLCPEFRFEDLTILPNSAMTWQLRMKPAAMLKNQALFSRAYAEYYGWNGVYFDQLSAIPPWRLTDFDAEAPGAGRFSEAHRNACLVAEKMREYYQGPVWSEGQSNYFYAGYIDTGYMQTLHPKDIHFVDYALREINSRMRPNGYDLFDNKANIDFMLSAEISLGSMGHLWDGVNGSVMFGAFKPAPKVWCNTLKSYFMLRQQQELAAASEPVKILYSVDGKEYTAGELMRRNIANSGMIHVVYADGLEVWSNRNPEKSWKIQLDGKTMKLPPFGYATILPGKFLEYSGNMANHRVDYVSGPAYVYVDGRGGKTEFPEITAAGAYLLEPDKDGTVRLTPEPFEKAETVEGLKFTSATPCRQDGTPCGEAFALDGGKLNVDGKAFSYLLK